LNLFARLMRIGKVMNPRTRLLRLALLPLLAIMVLANAASVPQRYTLDASASNVSAKVPFFGLASKTARFPRMQGAVTIVPGAPERAMIDVTFDATALEAPDSVTLARLRGEKFFWVEKYPTIRFVGRSLTLASATRGTVAGELTARGVTRPAKLDVTFDADPVAQAGRPVSFTGTTTIDRRDFGMKSYQLIVGNKVDITLKARMVPR
jgi:polyisoprenoid-binding protein YceI